MFDKLIESEPEGAEFHGRKRYFLVSSVVMGVLFTTAVVYSIYAADIGLGTDNFYLTAMIAPVAEPAVSPEIPRPRTALPQTEATSSVPTRKSIMSRTDEPTIVPDATSVVKNDQLSRPKSGVFKIDSVEAEPGSHSGPARSTGDPAMSTHATLTSAKVEEADVPEIAPPPVKKPAAKPVTQSLGVINGRAISLPIPRYPATANALNLQGKVDVQVLIGENGSVISANAVSGHPILRPSAVQAARGAKFSTTYLSKVPVKVSGIIVYNFKR